ncbi:hypothetical protein H1R17_05930 [Flavobacterium sp. xlx-214]|uniref:hypothetical protein n=1 Tax=unclassified Flavobacterium TaxID=196869 RepID=UPI0013D37D69|nr:MULTISPECIES: hypothetical protein [unclassified Flavobacterium]MBA5793009.1 hypothetical protein [Flavobacterium sp. xlx-221]QMI84662.1 hypothetical protein H1R17_05930 [Flavobacterium sp. xlx-214]
MLKIFNISTLLLFVCFLFAPTISYALNSDVDTYSLIISEEEETHSKNKSKSNNTVNEEEEKEIHYYTFEKYKNYLSQQPIFVVDSDFNNSIFKDNLVFKIPSPPPERNL